MNGKRLSLLTLAPLHVGSGSSVGVVDLPIQRERATQLPVIPGTALKGVLADLFLERMGEKWVRSEVGMGLFGTVSGAEQLKQGALKVGEARLAAFPVRSAKNAFVWVTAPMVLARLGIPWEAGMLQPSQGYGQEVCSFDKAFVLEEYRVDRLGDVPEAVVEAFGAFCDHPLWSSSVKTRLAVISDELFCYFAQNACEITNHNRIDDDTHTVVPGALFEQENVPSETLFVAELHAAKTETLEAVCKALEAQNYLLQIGADVTTGLGWCHTTLRDMK